MMKNLFEKNTFETRIGYSSNYALSLPIDDESQKAKLQFKINTEYAEVKDFKNKPKKEPIKPEVSKSEAVVEDEEDISMTDDTTKTENATELQTLIESIPTKTETPKLNTSAFTSATSMVLRDQETSTMLGSYKSDISEQLIKKRQTRNRAPAWHAPYKLKKVISGHTGWVRSITVDGSNEFFCTGSSDRTIKIWDLASGVLKLTLTGHVATVRSLDISTRSPYLFSGSEDCDGKLWDLEHNSCLRSFHGHSGGVTVIKHHPSLDLVMTGSKDRSVKVWDVRTNIAVRHLKSHQHQIADILVEPTDPQVITASHDCTIKLWDIIQNKVMTTLTHHQKSVRALVASPFDYTFASASTDSIRRWKLPEGTFMHRAQHTPEIINSLCVNDQGVMVSGGDTGRINLFDYKTGYKYQTIHLPPQPGSLESEKGIFACKFDVTGTRLITGEADKSIKIFAADTTATPESHPLLWDPHAKW